MHVTIRLALFGCVGWMLIAGPGYAVRAQEPTTPEPAASQRSDREADAAEDDAAQNNAKRDSGPEDSKAGNDSASGDDATSSEVAVSVEALVRRVRPSVVVISAAGRDASAKGVGTGFVVSGEGLIATNLHVIGEGRPLEVQTVDGRELKVESIHAWDRELDLAVLRVNLEGRPLTPLELGDSEKLADGLPVVVIGNPLGWKHSVVSGVLSGTRDVENRRMLQLAVPIEPGNSGGPVMDRRGRVLGVVTMKSAVTDNLGFAVQVNDLKLLLERPNPTPIARWLKIGSVDPKRWSTYFGAQWIERGGRVQVRGKGTGFGGRSLCAWISDLPERPFEVGVSVRLEDEDGAAGLMFHHDGEDRHYGFYPSNGRLRLSRFDGPSVFQWKVLREVESPHYRPGDWNHLKVRLEDGRFRCFVNDQLVIDQRDETLRGGRVGLAKFRDTVAHFKNFRVARQLPSTQPSSNQIARIDAWIEQLPALAEMTPGALDELLDQPAAGQNRLERQAQELERRAKEMRRVAADLHRAAVSRELQKLVEADPDRFSLLKACLIIARLDDSEVDPQAYVDQVERMAAEVRERLDDEADQRQRLETLNAYLFDENGFHGSRYDYYHVANSHMHRVIDDRTGLPITLSVLYMELAERLGVELVGVGLPGHFVVGREEDPTGETALIDVFNQGRVLSRAEAAELVRGTAGVELAEEHLEPVTHRRIITRVLGNLRGLAERRADREAMLRYLDALLAVAPEDVASRGARSIILFETGRHAASLADLDWILAERPEGLDLDRIRQMRDYFERTAAQRAAAHQAPAE